MSTEKELPASRNAEVHILFSGYAEPPPNPPTRGRVASTVSFVRDGEIRVIIDPGQVPGPENITEPLAALGETPESSTDVIFSNHHPDHILNAALFPNARFHDHSTIRQDDWWQRQDAEGYEVSSSIVLIRTPGHTPQDITTLVGTTEGVVAFTHLWWTASTPTEDPFASDSAALHRNRVRVLKLAKLIVPGHGSPFTPDDSTPR